MGVIKSHVCLEGWGSAGVTFGESQLEHGNSEDLRKKCYPALLGLLNAPSHPHSSRGVPSGGSALSEQPPLVCWVTLPNFSSDDDKFHSVWFPRDSKSILRGLDTCFRKSRVSQSAWYFAPVAQLVSSQDAGSMVGDTRARCPGLQSILN